MEAHFSAIISFILTYRYLVILPIAIFEGPIITIILAFLAAQGYFNVIPVYLILILGDLMGDMLYYGLGRFGHIIATSVVGRKLGVKDHHLDRVDKHFKDHSGKTLLFGKWTHTAGAVILTSAGVAKMPMGKFLLYNLIGTLPKTLVLMFVGYYLGYAFLRINSVIEKVGFVLGALIVMGVLVYLATRYMKKKKIQTNEPELAIDLQKTVMVFGVFDTLHEGHRFFIQEAQNLGNTLVAVIARDSIVAAYKGRKPDQNERVRLETLQKEYPEVTVVLGDETENSWGVIKQYQPDIIALGYDQEKLREALGVTIPTLPFPTMLVTINDHRGDELHSSLLRNK